MSMVARVRIDRPRVFSTLEELPASKAIEIKDIASVMQAAMNLRFLHRHKRCWVFVSSKDFPKEMLAELEMSRYKINVLVNRAENKLVMIKDEKAFNELKWHMGLEIDRSCLNKIQFGQPLAFGVGFNPGGKLSIDGMYQPFNMAQVAVIGKEPPPPMAITEESFVQTPFTGLLRTTFPDSLQVRKNQTVARVVYPDGSESEFPVTPGTTIRLE